MPDNIRNVPNDMEDICSSSSGYKKNKGIDLYAKSVFNNLGNVIKIIAFVVGFGIVIISLVLAFFLFSKTLLSFAISLGIIIFGTIMAAILFFPIYGIGHIISQNNEILRKL